MLNRRRWQQLAAVAAGATGIYLAYRRWAEYKQEQEDAEAAKTYYRSSRREHADEAAEPGEPLFGSTLDAEPWLERMELLVGRQGLKCMAQSHVLVVGLGGVGSYAAEFLVRAGVGKLTIMDGDDFDRTNRNRQLGALRSTEGMMKAVVMGKRLLDVNPELDLRTLPVFLECDECDKLIREEGFDYVIDCIDSLQPKLHLMQAALKHSVPIVSSMGAGGKTDPSQVKLGDISETDMDPFAKFIRKRLRKQFGILSGVAAVYSVERPDKSSVKVTDGNNYKKSFYGTISYLPCVFGLYAASLVIRELGLQKKVMYTKTRRYLLKQGRSAAYTTDYFTRRAQGLLAGDDDSDSERPQPAVEASSAKGKTAEAVGEEISKISGKAINAGAGEDRAVKKTIDRRSASKGKAGNIKAEGGNGDGEAAEGGAQGEKKGKRPRPEGRLKEVERQLEEAKAEAGMWRSKYEGAVHARARAEMQQVKDNLRRWSMDDPKARRTYESESDAGSDGLSRFGEDGTVIASGGMFEGVSKGAPSSPATAAAAPRQGEDGQGSAGTQPTDSARQWPGDEERDSNSQFSSEAGSRAGGLSPVRMTFV